MSESLPPVWVRRTLPPVIAAIPPVWVIPPEGAIRIVIIFLLLLPEIDLCDFEEGILILHFVNLAGAQSLELSGQCYLPVAFKYQGIDKTVFLWKERKEPEMRCP